MRALILLLVINQAHAAEIKTIETSKLTFNNNQVTNIASCVLSKEMSGVESDKAFKECLKLTKVKQ